MSYVPISAREAFHRQPDFDPDTRQDVLVTFRITCLEKYDDGYLVVYHDHLGMQCTFLVPADFRLLQMVSQLNASPLPAARPIAADAARPTARPAAKPAATTGLTFDLRRQIKRVLEKSRQVAAHRFVTHEDGSMSVKHGYLQPDGRTADRWAKLVQAELEAQGILVEINARDEHREYPAQSYFCAHIVAVL